LKKLLEPKSYFQHPNKRLHVCVGVSPIVRRARKLWLFHSPISSDSERFAAETLNEIKKKMEAKGYTLPFNFGFIEEDVKVKGLFVYDNIITIRQGTAEQKSTSRISFQFDKTSLVSFSNAMENAMRCLELIRTLKSK
tara:strand:- start:8921 stop:9334 length:414 start_codon:yes stop_codon:yes gene_type:complete